MKWDEHSDISKNSEPAKHPYQFPEHHVNLFDTIPKWGHIEKTF